MNEACKFCKYFENGKCYNKDVIEEQTKDIAVDTVMYAIENSDVNIAIEEANIQSKIAKTIMKAIYDNSDLKMSDKAIRILEEMLKEDIDFAYIFEKMQEAVEGAIIAGARNLKRNDDNLFEPKNPSEFCCKYFF